MVLELLDFFRIRFPAFSNFIVQFFNNAELTGLVRYKEFLVQFLDIVSRNRICYLLNGEIVSGHEHLTCLCCTNPYPPVRIRLIIPYEIADDRLVIVIDAEILVVFPSLLFAWTKIKIPYDDFLTHPPVDELEQSSDEPYDLLRVLEVM